MTTALSAQSEDDLLMPATIRRSARPFSSTFLRTYDGKAAVTLQFTDTQGKVIRAVTPHRAESRYRQRCTDGNEIERRQSAV
jgi:hypothetical protein